MKRSDGFRLGRRLAVPDSIFDARFSAGLASPRRRYATEYFAYGKDGYRRADGMVDCAVKVVTNPNLQRCIPS